eukprot:g1930.t1
MKRTPLSIAVPIDGTDRELGLKQLEQFALRKRSFRSQYRRFHGPFVEYLTPEELRDGLRDWKEFLHCTVKDIKLQLAVYTIPGSLLALSERVDENLALFMANYLYLLSIITVMMLGPLLGTLTLVLLGSYRWIHDSAVLDTNASVKELKVFCVRFVYPVVSLLLCLVTSLGLRISSGMIVGMLVVVLHASLHRAPSEFRYARQNRVVRWIRRHRASTEGHELFWNDLKHYVRERFSDWLLTFQWELLRVRDYIALWKLILIRKIKSRGNKDQVQLVKTSQ